MSGGQCHLFVRSSIRSLACLLVCSFARSFARSFVRSFVRLFVRSFVRAMHYREPLKSCEIRIGHSPGFSLPSVVILP